LEQKSVRLPSKQAWLPNSFARLQHCVNARTAFISTIAILDGCGGQADTKGKKE
jgi:dTDP-4-dehydrorhamnose reductase